ncbi:MAG TPA: YvcK family protein [Clostridiales bacterium]|nr:YvcK family protein [Clostridiales bacterium]
MRIAVLGGGTGLSALLRGLKNFTEDITAIVTVADDGGSSGMLRQDLGILPPGDIRNCIMALANVEPLMEKVMQYRFKEGSLKGQSLGNLFIAAMTDLCNGFEEAVKQMSNVLAVTGRVLPVSLANISLCARLENGTLIKGESLIPKIQMEQNSPISEVFLIPRDAKPLPDALEALQEADCIVIGPGSLYTSIMPHLLLPEITQSIRSSKAVRIYVANIMTQPGETTGYTLEDHVKAIMRHGGEDLIDIIIANHQQPPEDILNRYLQDGSEPVYHSKDCPAIMGIPVLAHDLIDIYRGYIRHNPLKLADLVMRVAENGFPRAASD